MAPRSLWLDWPRRALRVWYSFTKCPLSAPVWDEWYLRSGILAGSRVDLPAGLQHSCNPCF